MDAAPQPLLHTDLFALDLLVDGGRVVLVSGELAVPDGAVVGTLDTFGSPVLRGRLSLAVPAELRFRPTGARGLTVTEPPPTGTGAGRGAGTAPGSPTRVSVVAELAEGAGFLRFAISGVAAPELVPGSDTTVQVQLRGGEYFFELRPEATAEAAAMPVALNRRTHFTARQASQ